MREFFDLQNVILIGAETLNNAVRSIVGCEFCSRAAGLSFDFILDRVTGHYPDVTDYVMVDCVARCPQCGRGLTTKTLVEITASLGRSGELRDRHLS